MTVPTEIQQSLNILAYGAFPPASGGIRDAQKAANDWAGTSNLDLLAALNCKHYSATTPLPTNRPMGLNEVCNALAGTSLLDAQQALSQLAGAAVPTNITLIGSPTYASNLTTASSVATITRTGVTAGNSLILMVGADELSAVSVSTVAGGGTWAKLIDVSNVNANPVYAALYYLQTSAGGSVTVTVTFTGDIRAQGLGMELLELNGAIGVQASGGTGSTFSTNGVTNNTSATLTPTVNGSFIIFLNVNANGTPTVSPSAPWTADAGPQLFASLSLATSAYQIQAVAAATSATWTTNGGFANVGAIIQP